MTSVSGEMNSVTRCWRGPTDTSAPMRTTSSRSFTLWPSEALHISSTTCCPERQRSDKRWALRSHPWPQPFIESHPFSFSHPGRPSPFSLTLRSAPDSPFELVRLAKGMSNMFKKKVADQPATRRAVPTSGTRRSGACLHPCNLTGCTRADHGRTLLYASTFHPKQRRCQASLVARPAHKEGCRNRTRLCSAFAFAAVPASFAVSVGMPLLSMESLKVSLQRLQSRVMLALPAIGSETRLERLALI